jgi:hypothetical protein
MLCLQGRGVCRRGFCHCKAGWWGISDVQLICLTVSNSLTDVSPANTLLRAGARGVSARLLSLKDGVVGHL